MSAREFLFARLTGALIPEEQANKMIDDLLHEEAEKQREYVRKMANDLMHYGSSWWAIKGVDEAAELIDPYAK